jgi:hypothetical protein
MHSRRRERRNGSNNRHAHLIATSER